MRLCLRTVRCEIRYVSRAEAEKLGLRKLPPAERDELRLIEIADFDLSACGGTHVGTSGQIGSILLRKTEKVRQGTRVEFVCGAVRFAWRGVDYGALSEAAALFSAKLWDVPEQIRKSVEESKLLRKQKDDALDQLAELMALAALHNQPERNGRKIIVQAFSDRDIGFAKLFAQKVTRTATPAIALVASTVNPPGLVFAQTPAVPGAAGSPTWGRCSSRCCRPSEDAAVEAAISLRAEFRRAPMSTAAFAAGSGYNRKLIPYGAPFLAKKVIRWRGHLARQLGVPAGRPALHQQVHSMLEPRLILVNLLIKLGVAAAVSSALVRSKEFKSLLFREQREHPAQRSTWRCGWRSRSPSASGYDAASRVSSPATCRSKPRCCWASSADACREVSAER